jgi:hypothetical protein
LLQQFPKQIKVKRDLELLLIKLYALKRSSQYYVEMWRMKGAIIKSLQ